MRRVWAIRWQSRVALSKISSHLMATTVCCCANILAATTLDTTIVGNGSPGPYLLGTVFIDSASIVVSFSDSAAGAGAFPFVYIDHLNAILFSAPLDSGVSFRLTARRRYPGLSKIHTLYEKKVLTTSDSAAWSENLPRQRPATPPSTGNTELEVSGYKSVIVSVGSQGQANLEQALDVTIGGRIAENVELRGHLSDQGSSLEGATREISEIDRIYLSVIHPHAGATVGDQYLRWPTGGILSGEKKVKGISATASARNLSATVFGAITGGSFASQTIRGRTGLQGPYFLTGNGESPFVSPLSGTVSVWVNGTKLREGENADYQVNYDFGSITFTPKIPIDDNDVIHVEYEYKVFDYQRTLIGTEIGAAKVDSIASFVGVLWYEADNANHPLDLGELTPADRDSLAAAGDRRYLKPMMAYPVDPNDADSAATYTGLYVKERDSLGREFFVWAPNVRVGVQLYRVSFRRVDDGSGEYTDTIVCPQGRSGLCYNVYRFVGSGGNYSASSLLPSPQRGVRGEVMASIRPARWAEVTLDIAGQENDRNTLSRKDDHDNRAAATRTGFLLGRRRTDARALWLQGQHQFASRQFCADLLLSTLQRRTVWNDTALRASWASQHVWEAGVGITAVPHVTTEFSYGQRWHDSLITHRISNSTSAAVTQHLKASYQGALFNHFDAVPHAHSRRNNFRLSFDSRRVGAWLVAGDEWWWTAGSGRGHGRGEIGFSYHPWHMQETFKLVRERAGSRDLLSADTATSWLWQQTFDHAWLTGWNLRGSSAYSQRTFIRPQHRIRSILIDLSSDIRGGESGFSSTQRYMVSSERASVFVQQPKYVGQGLGTHIIDTSLATDRYVPKIGGDWIIVEREITDATSEARMCKSALDIGWTFSPRSKGSSTLLTDLKWEGKARINEHARLDTAPQWNNWIPGYASFSGADTLLEFADLSYRQTVDWRPWFDDGLHAGIFVVPFLKVVRGYRESGAETGGTVDKMWRRWFVQVQTRLLHFSRRTSVARYHIDDRWIELTVKRFLPSDIEGYVAAGTGHAQKEPSLSRSRGWYYSLRPGCSWTPAKKGRADASYSLSWVNLQESDYRMARGLPAGLSHIIDLMADVALGHNFFLNASYRGEITRPVDRKEYLPGTHVLRVGMKAYL